MANCSAVYARAGWMIARSSWFRVITERRSVNTRTTSPIRCSFTMKTSVCRISSRRPALSPITFRHAGVASVIDTAPTILDLLGYPVPAQHQGRSLLTSEARPAFFFTDYSLGWLGLGIRAGSISTRSILVGRSCSTCAAIPTKSAIAQHRFLSRALMSIAAACSAGLPRRRHAVTAWR